MAFAAQTLPADLSGKHVLILMSTFGHPADERYLDTLVGALLGGGMTGGGIHVEYLDLLRQMSADERRQQAAFLVRKYANRDIDLVFTLGQPSLTFLLEDIPEVASQAPVLSWNAQVPAVAVTGRRHFVTQMAMLDFRGTLRRALELFPKTERVIVIQGNSEQEVARRELIRVELSPWKDKLQIEQTYSLSAGEIEAKLAAAPKNTVIMGVGITQDGKGQIFIPAEFIERMLMSAKSPYFVLFDINIGIGTIGGMVSNTRDDATLMANNAIDILRGKTRLTEPVTTLQSVSVPMFDWRQLERWGAKTGALPANTIFINRPPTLWEQHRTEVIAAGIVFVVLTFLIAGLSILNRRLKKTKDDALESEARFRVMVERAPEAIIVLDVDTNRIVDANTKAEKLFGCDLGKLLQGGLERFYPPLQPDGMDVAQSVNEHRSRVLTGEEVMFERAIHSEDGRDYLCEVRLAQLPYREQRLVRASFVDITERKQMESVQAFLAQTGTGAVVDPFFKALARFLAESLQMDFVCIDRLEGDRRNARTLAVWHDGHFEDNVTYALKDTPCGDVVGQQVCCFTAGVTKLFPKDQVLQDLRAESYAGVTLWSHDRQPIGLIAVISCKPLANRSQVEAVLKMVAGRAAGELERLQAEAQLRQSQKMESVGHLAGGVAHDFNNILGGMLMQMEMLKMENQLPSAVFDGLTNLRVDAERAANLVRQLLLYSRRSMMQSCDLDLNEVVTNFNKMLRRIIGEDVTLQVRLHTKALHLHADPGMIEQVLMNLAVNSRDAMSKGGKLVVETTAVTLDAAAAERLGAESGPGNYVCLSVSDTGRGIPPENLDKIFEPFFTTKDIGKGTGLGLASVFGIVKQHKGCIEMDNRPGQGVTFKVYLPALAGPFTKTDSATDQSAIHRGKETILWVEDEESLRKATRRALEQYGFKVLEAASGVEAMGVWRKNRDTVNLLLTDLMLPGGLSGLELAKCLLAEKPDLKVVYVSGYSLDAIEGGLELGAGQNFIQKPFGPDPLLRTLRQTLDV